MDTELFFWSNAVRDVKLNFMQLEQSFLHFGKRCVTDDITVCIHTRYAPGLHGVVLDA